MRLRSGLYLRILSYIALTTPLHAQSVTDTARAIARIDRELVQADSVLDRDVWPGYHFARLGLMYVIPGKAKLAAHWPVAAPEGMRVLDGFADVAYTDTGVVRWQAGLPVASLAIAPSQTRAAVAGLALHEAFHAFEVTQRRDDRRFGRGENSMLTARYPIFDVENEALFSVEAKLLRAAVLGQSDAEARAQARQFLAVRARRYARMDTTFVNYEQLAEMHEGLAQYTLIRGLAVMARRNSAYVEGAAQEKQAEGDLLMDVLKQTDRSPRRRAYATGSYLGLLLDRLAGPSWKQRVMQHDEFLHVILRNVVGDAQVSSTTEAKIAAAVPVALRNVNTLRSARVAKRDSVLASNKLMLVIDPAASVRGFDWCGFDPQNLLMTGSGQLLHMRMLNLCNAGQRIAGIYQPAVQDEMSGRVATAVDPAQLRFTIGGNASELPQAGASVDVEKLRLWTDDVEIEIARATLIRGPKSLIVVPH